MSHIDDYGSDPTNDIIDNIDNPSGEGVQWPSSYDDRPVVYGDDD